MNVLFGKIGFGWYRLLLQAEKRERIRSLGKMDIDMKQLVGTFQATNETDKK